MNNILFVNNTIENCGVHQYGQNTAFLLEQSTKYNFLYRECGTVAECVAESNAHSPLAIIYNYSGTTLGWCTDAMVSLLPNTKHMILYHEFGHPFTKFHRIISQDPTEPEVGNIRTTPRLLFPYANTHPLPEVPTIGSFGFAFDVKGFERLINKVNADFDEAVVKLHMAPSAFGDPTGELSQSMLSKCRSLAKPGISVEGSFSFKTRDDLIDWLGCNTINVFMYDVLPGRGISGVLDFAISSGRPIAITKSDMFRHIHPFELPIYLENCSIRDIIQGGVEVLNVAKEAWSNAELVSKYESIIEEVTAP